MKAILLLTALTLTGCMGIIETKNEHAKIMVETVIEVCGAGKVLIESRSDIGDDSSNSVFKLECNKDSKANKVGI